jgi:prepilin-type processing-associated H-X9-DG protein
MRKRLEPVIGLWWWVFGLVGVLLTIGIGLPLLGTRTSCGMDVVRQSNLRSLAVAMGNYVEDFNGQLFAAEKWHEVMDPWLGIDGDDPVYFPEYDSQFYLLPFPWEDNRMPSDLTKKQLSMIPFMFEEQRLSTDGTSVAFWDGHVHALYDYEFAELIDVSKGIPLGNRKQRDDP